MLERALREKDAGGASMADLPRGRTSEVDEIMKSQRSRDECNRLRDELRQQEKHWEETVAAAVKATLKREAENGNAADTSADRFAALEHKVNQAMEESGSVRSSLDAAMKLEQALVRQQKEIESAALSRFSALEKKVESFSEAYKATQDDLKGRLDRGREHQMQLQSLLEHASGNLVDVRDQIILDGPLSSSDADSLAMTPRSADKEKKKKKKKAKNNDDDSILLKGALKS